MRLLNYTKMAILVVTVWMSVYFALIWFRMLKNRHSTSIRLLIQTSRRHLAALYADQEDQHEV